MLLLLIYFRSRISSEKDTVVDAGKQRQILSDAERNQGFHIIEGYSDYQTEIISVLLAQGRICLSSYSTGHCEQLQPHVSQNDWYKAGGCTRK
jgi:hypothetical protein